MGPATKAGDRISQGAVFARISGTKDRSTLLPPHLHIALAKARMLPQAGQLTWEMLNKMDRSVFWDPLAVLNPDYYVIHYDGAVNVCELHAKCSQVKLPAGI